MTDFERYELEELKKSHDSLLTLLENISKAANWNDETDVARNIFKANRNVIERARQVSRA